MIRFGPAGAADSFAAMGYKKTAQMPEYLEKMGLTAFEYQCGRGVRITDEAARALGRGLPAAGHRCVAACALLYLHVLAGRGKAAG